MPDLPPDLVPIQQAPNGLPPDLIPIQQGTQPSGGNDLSGSPLSLLSYLPIRHDQGGTHFAVPSVLESILGTPGAMEKGGRAAFGGGPMPSPQEMVGLASLGTSFSPAFRTGRAVAAVTEPRPSPVMGVLRDVSGGGEIPPVAGGGRVEPLPAIPPAIPSGPQPPRLTGQPLPQTRPGEPALPGGAARPSPLMPTAAESGGLQPPRPTEGAMPTPRAGEPAPAGGRAEPAEPAPEPSSFATAIISNDSKPIDQAIVSMYRRAVKPPLRGGKTEQAMQAQDRQIMTMVDQIHDNAANIKLTAPNGTPLPPGTMPQTLRQTAEALDQQEGSLYQTYDRMAKEAGDAGVRVNVAPVVAELRSIASKPEVGTLSPAIREYASQVADEIELRGNLSPSGAQALIQHANSKLEPFFNNPTNESISQSAVLNPAMRVMRKQLDEAVSSIKGPGYQAIRNRLGALKAVRADLVRAAQREANKAPQPFRDVLFNGVSSAEALRGLFTMDPSAIGTVTGIKATQYWMRRINDPNRAIQRLFAIRAQPIRAPMQFRPALGSAALSLGGQTAVGGGLAGLPPAPPKVGDRGPAGGTVTGVRSVRVPPRPSSAPSDYIEPPGR